MKNIYKITFNCYIAPKEPYFTLPRDLEEVYKETKILRKERYISAFTEQEATKHLKHKWDCPITIINIKKENTKQSERQR